MIKNIPIKNISLKEQQPFINLVDKILEAMKQGKDSSEFDNNIDEMVYNLYDLTKDEIKIVEGK